MDCDGALNISPFQKGKHCMGLDHFLAHGTRTSTTHNFLKSPLPMCYLSPTIQMVPLYKDLVNILYYATFIGIGFKIF